ncbi:hypothetical protein ACHAWX_000150 [Stephanocyclus meneghinianus]
MNTLCHQACRVNSRLSCTRRNLHLACQNPLFPRLQLTLRHPSKSNYQREAECTHSNSRQQKSKRQTSMSKAKIKLKLSNRKKMKD